MKVPEYKPRYGFAIWVGFSVVDFIYLQHGALSLLGFGIAYAWAMGRIPITSGEVRYPDE